MRVRPHRSAGNFPVELTSFVGRRRELAEAKHMLPAARLLTLTGIAGVGKTRLALRVASAAYRDFPDGVWLVDLADLHDPRLLPNTVATALGLRGGSDPAAILAEYIVDKQLLLVLDNCEHLAAECAVLVARLLAASDRVRILATSQHTLHVEGEQVLQIEPLTVPSADDDMGVGARDAVTLFVERATSVLAGFELTPGNWKTVVRICRRLEGIPLAIELAAVRVRVLSVGQILARLDDRFGLLTTHQVATQPRQRALEATIGWSFELCSPGEQRLWTRLSAFPGGFDLAAAEYTCASDVDNVAELVNGLLDKSILYRQDSTSGGTWYRMLETVREYGSAKLAEGAGDRDVRARQVEHYVNLARQYRAEGFGPRQLEWIGRLQREHANFRDVLGHCLAVSERASYALEIASALWNYWYAGGLVLEGYQYLRRGLELCDQDTIVCAEALYAASFLAIQIGDAAAGHLLAGLAELAEKLDDERLRAGHAECAGMAAFFAGDLRGGAELLERGLAGYRAAGDPLLVFDTLILLAAVRLFLDDPQGMANANEALDLTRRYEARWSRGYALWAVAVQQWRADRHQKATELLQEAIALRLTDRTLLAFLLEALSWCQSRAGDHDRAARLLGSAHAVWRLSGARINETSPYHTFDEQCGARIRAAIGDLAHDTAFAEGAGWGLDDVIRYALRDKPKTAAHERERAGRPGTLTKRQQEIAELVAQGMTNKEIAAVLVIDRRTVESHVESILRKLGFASRTEVASWLAGQAP